MVPNSSANPYLACSSRRAPSAELLSRAVEYRGRSAAAKPASSSSRLPAIPVPHPCHELLRLRAGQAKGGCVPPPVPRLRKAAGLDDVAGVNDSQRRPELRGIDSEPLPPPAQPPIRRLDALKHAADIERNRPYRHDTTMAQAAIDAPFFPE